jgi:hypothetical protein
MSLPLVIYRKPLTMHEGKSGRQKLGRLCQTPGLGDASQPNHTPHYVVVPHRV